MNSALWHGSCARDECKWSKEYDKRRMWATSVTHMRPVNDCCTTHEPRPRIWKIRNKRYCIKRHIKHSHMSEDSRTNGDDENWRHKTTTTYYMNQFVNKRKNCLNASTQNDFLFSQYSKDTEEHHMIVRVRDIWELRIYMQSPRALFSCWFYRFASRKWQTIRIWHSNSTRVQWP